MTVGVEKMLYKNQIIILLVANGRTIFKTLIFNVNMSKLAKILETSYNQA